MSRSPSWGVVATVRAEPRAILDFAAYHLDLGATRVYLYLDAPCPDARRALGAHPFCRSRHCDEAYWKRRGRGGLRPPDHQTRQALNATHCLQRARGIDWLVHLDLDEFLLPGPTPLPEQLAALPDTTLAARIRPIEALAPDPGAPADAARWFKSCAPDPATRRAETAAIYPTYGPDLDGGFLSHVAGKIVVRTGQAGVRLRIHNAFCRGQELPAAELQGTRLCHLHGERYEDWRARLGFRLRAGAYRDALAPPAGAPAGAKNMHALLGGLAARGEAALRDFHQEVATATPALRDRLAAHGHLHRATLDLDAKRARHFPDFA